MKRSDDLHREERSRYQRDKSNRSREPRGDASRPGQEPRFLPSGREESLSRNENRQSNERVYEARETLARSDHSASVDEQPLGFSSPSTEGHYELEHGKGGLRSLPKTTGPRHVSNDPSYSQRYTTYSGSPPGGTGMIPSAYSSPMNPVHLTSSHGNSNQRTFGQLSSGMPMRTMPPNPERAAASILATLSSDVLDFIDIQTNKFEKIRDFFDDNPEFHSHVTTRILDEAAAEAHSLEDVALRQRCIQRRVIVSQCVKEDGYNLEYLNRLIKNIPKVREHFYKACDTVANEIKSKQASKPTSNTTSMPQSPGYHLSTTPMISSHPWNSGGSHQQRPSMQYGSQQNVGYGSNYPVGQSPFDLRNSQSQSYSQPQTSHREPFPGISAISGMTAQISADNTGRRPSYDFQQADFADLRQVQTSSNNAPNVVTSNPVTVPDLTQEVSARPLVRRGSEHDPRPGRPSFSQQVVNRPRGGLTRITEVAANRSITVEAKDQFPDPESVDSRYKVPNNGRTFFAKYQVFLMMFPEPRGDNRRRSSRPPDTGPDDSRIKFRDRRGEEIFVHEKRFMVIRERQGYCICIPINSYRRNGVGYKNIPKREKEAHAVVFDDKNHEPGLLPGEEDITKNAIALKMINQHTLGNASRIHFGKVYTIEWNFKVLKIGQVAPDSQNDVEAYWQEEFLR